MPDYFDSLIDKGEAKLEPILADAVRAYIKGNVNRFIDKTGELSDIVVFAQTFSDLWGRRSIIETIQQQRVPRAAIQFGKGAPGFDDAIEALTTKNAYLMEPLDFVREAYGRRRTLHEQDMQASIMKRVDKFVADALRRGETEPSATKLLAETEGWRQSYATTVYRTNVGNAFAAGQWAEATKPAFKRIFPAFKYDATLDSDTRPNHGAASGFIADVDDPAWDRFAPPLGFNCFLPGTVVRGSFVGGSRAFYRGEVIDVRTRKGCRLRVTANHPVFSVSQGAWVRASSLVKGEQVISDAVNIEGFAGRAANGGLPFVPVGDGAVDDNQAPARVEDVFDALRREGAGAVSARVTPLDFHGDARFFDGGIDVASLDGALEGRPDAMRFEHVNEFGDVLFPSSASDASHAFGPLDPFSGGDHSPLGGVPSGSALAADSSLALALDRRPLHALRFGSASWLDTVFAEDTVDDVTADPMFVSQLLDAAAGSVGLDEVVEVRRIPLWSGHVYDLQSVTGWMIASGIASHNCRCVLVSQTERQLRQRGLIDAEGRVTPYIPPRMAQGEAFPDPGFVKRVRPDREMYGQA